MIAATYARKSADQIGAGSEAVAEPQGEHDGQAHVVGEEAQQGTQWERIQRRPADPCHAPGDLSSLRAIESHLPVDTGTMEQRLDDILRELHRHRPARD